MQKVLFLYKIVKMKTLKLQKKFINFFLLSKFQSISFLKSIISDLKFEYVFIKPDLVIIFSTIKI